MAHNCHFMLTSMAVILTMSKTKEKEWRFMNKKEV